VIVILFLSGSQHVLPSKRATILNDHDSPDMNTALPISVFSSAISSHGSISTVKTSALDNLSLLEQLYYSGVMYLR
jgi:hypothetical protein